MAKRTSVSRPTTDRRALAALCLAVMVPSAFSGSEDRALKAARIRLADAFARKDMRAIGPLVADGWSGLRFCEGWPDDLWRDAADALREATLVATGAEDARYATHWPLHGEGRQPKSLIFHRMARDTWTLDLSSFLGPFPHL